MTQESIFGKVVAQVFPPGTSGHCARTKVWCEDEKFAA